jgi:hypothetical protein
MSDLAIAKGVGAALFVMSAEERGFSRRLVDHLICWLCHHATAPQHDCRHVGAERLCGLEVDEPMRPFVACTTGSSDGLAPARIRSVRR